MDELKFRRALYADPKNLPPEHQAALREPKHQQAKRDIDELDSAIHEALCVSVPDGLCDRIIWQQSEQNHWHQRLNRQRFGIAASVVLMAGLWGAFWHSSEPDLAQHALAHVYHEPKSLSANHGVATQLVNTKLASIGAQLVDDMGDWLFAAYCTFDGVTSLHLVLADEQGQKVTVFVVPRSEGSSSAERFSDNRYTGKQIAYDKANVLLVSESTHAIANIEQRLRESLRFLI